jgi:DNA (cytosine-5)-methyltransferase 1
MFNTLDLFAGIGGFSLGLERTGGFRTAAFCEIDRKAQKVLNKHWPDVPVFEDVSALTKEKIDETVGVPIHVITGGFPCQDISLAGRGAGLEGERSGLWFQFHRLIKEVQPRYVFIENVSALRSRGLDAVVSGLNEIGYDAEWHCLPASAVGAPHQRDRLWIVAYVADPSSKGRQGRLHRWAHQEREGELGHLGRCRSVDGQPIENWWAVEPDVGRVAHGVSGRVDRLKQLGNAVVPQIPQLLGEAILGWENNNAN